MTSKIRDLFFRYALWIKNCLKNLEIKTMIYISTNESYHVLDPTTPWYEWLSYCEVCESLGPIPGQPSLGRFMAYRRYLKSVGVI